MRASFLGQNVCALGFGIATLQAPRLVMDQPAEEEPRTPSGEESGKVDEKSNLTPSTSAVTIPPRLCA
jgi:hypothetical protein